jgi:hypothetical protein
MPNALLLIAALLCCNLGMGWLALAMNTHWQQVRGKRLQSVTAQWVLRLLGALALAISLMLCLVADHASMAVLVWIMAITGSALLVTFILAWRPTWLTPLVIWAR